MTTIIFAAVDVPASQPLPQTVVLSGNMQLTFSCAGGRLALASLSDRQSREWIGPVAPDTALWRLAARGPASAAVEWTSASVPLATVDSDRGGATFTWKAALPGAAALIRLRVQMDASSGLSKWSLDAELPEGWKVVRADWPIVAGIKPAPTLKMAVPFGWGLEYDVKPGMSYDGTYPSLVASMPFVAFYDQGRGLYVGCHDALGHHKHISVKATEGGAAATLTHWPCEADTAAGRYAPGFHIAIGLFQGDYWEAAQIYRVFSSHTPWGRLPSADAPGNTARRAPDWLRAIDLWLMPEAEPLKNVEACRKAGEFFGVPTGLHWYNWHEIPFDTLYPDYFPAKPSFAEGVKALQQAGFRVMPYINGRLCDPKSKAWTQQGADKAAARQENGEPYAEVYGTKIPLHVMCPAARPWRDTISGTVQRLFNECHVDGVYIDQIGAAGAVRCFSRDHGHSPGGGTFWHDGYRQMLAQIRESMPAGRILTTEENAECWNDQFDALLMVNTPSAADRRMVPIMPSVYAGRIPTFGFQYLSPDDVSRSIPFRAKMARAFLWGSQLGWVGVQVIMADGARREAEFLRNLARVRQANHDCLLDGRFLGDLEISGGKPSLHVEANGGSPAVEVPAVMASAWLSAGRKLCLVVVNLADEARVVVLQPPWQRVYRIKDGLDDSSTSAPASRDDPARVHIRISARNATVVRVTPRSK